MKSRSTAQRRSSWARAKAADAGKGWATPSSSRPDGSGATHSSAGRAGHEGRRPGPAQVVVGAREGGRRREGVVDAVILEAPRQRGDPLERREGVAVGQVVDLPERLRARLEPDQLQRDLPGPGRD